APSTKAIAMDEASLSDFDGTLVLVGAGKMGGAMLEGWHRLGLSFDNVVALEPEPSPEIITLGARGLRINPSLDTISATAIGIADETLMDAVTAVSGSGPAYVFLLAESLARAGTAAGLPADLAARLARATVAGSGELMARSPLDPATLRKNVTSPGGTTAAALDILTAPDGLGALMDRAIAAATRRSRELAG